MKANDAPMEGLMILKANRMLSELKALVRTWVGSQPVEAIHEDPSIAKRLELVEHGVAMIQAGLYDRRCT